MSSSEWLPPPVPFEIVRRGYSPDQVTAHIEKLEYDLRIATANRDATSERLTELTAQLSTAQAEADALRSQLDRQALEPMSMSGLSDRMQRLIRIAEEEAAESRTAAEEYSSELREQAESDTAALRAQAESDAAELRATVRSEAERTRSELQAQRTELAEARSAFDAERDRTRTQLSEQVSALLVEATAQAEATRAQATEEAERMIAEAEVAADRLVSGAREESERLAAEAAVRRAEQEEDFTLAINARRAEAHRAITEAEQTSRADAATRIERATAHATNLVDSATRHADEIVTRAAAESHQRVLDADAAVQALTSLRSELHRQLARLGEHLAEVQQMVGSAAPVLEPPAAERDRPVPADFPVDPAERPTVADGYPATAPDWQPPDAPPDPADERGGDLTAALAADEEPVTESHGDAEEPVTESRSDGDHPGPEQRSEQPAEPTGSDSVEEITVRSSAG